MITDVVQAGPRPSGDGAVDRVAVLIRPPFPINFNRPFEHEVGAVRDVT